MGSFYLILVLIAFSISQVQSLHLLQSLVADGYTAILTSPLITCTFNEDLNLNVNLTNIYWYNKNETYNYFISEAAEELQANTDFDKNNTILILVTGFGVQHNASAVTEVINKAKTLPDTSVLHLDYYNYCKSSSIIFRITDYESAVAYSYYVAKALAEFLIGLKELIGIKFENIHLIGHSLGAQVSGMAGRIVLNSTGEQLERISGLDPAGPCFNKAEIEYQLNWRNAARVEVYHSNMGQLGTTNSNGHVNYYPDGGGPMRVVCQSEVNPLTAASCSHAQIVSDFIDSMSYTEEFVGRACDSWSDFQNCKCVNSSLAIAGQYSDKNATGNYFYFTNTTSPFGQGVSGATPESCQ